MLIETISNFLPSERVTWNDPDGQITEVGLFARAFSSTDKQITEIGLFACAFSSTDG